MKLIVGLGNPGEGYINSRHNIGFRCINHFAKLHRISLNQRKCQARIGIGEVAGNEVVLAKPGTFMNLSGKAVSLLEQRFRISLSDLLVIYDDLDLPLGNLRIREAGGSGGHKGMESIIACLGSQTFPRIRVGIGRPEENSWDTTSYVLGDFSPQEEPIIGKAVARVAEVILCFLTEGVTAAMNKYNRSAP